MEKCIDIYSLYRNCRSAERAAGVAALCKTFSAKETVDMAAVELSLVNWRVKTNRTDLGGKNILVQLGFYLSN